MQHSIADRESLCRAVVDAHATVSGQTWDVATSLLMPAVHIFTNERQPDRFQIRQLLAGLGSLIASLPNDVITLYSALPNARVYGHVIPPHLRPQAAQGPPEEDVFRVALTAAEQNAPWPSHPVNTEILHETVTALAGRMRCRRDVLVAVAVRHLMLLLSDAQPVERRWLTRRIAWLLECDATDGAELLVRLTQGDDPLIRLDVPVTASNSPLIAEGAMGLSGWAKWPIESGVLTLGGRVQSVRRHRQSTFVDLGWNAQCAQLMLARLESRPQIRPGDLLVVSGSVGRSRTNTPTLFVQQIEQHQRARGRVPSSVRSDEMRAVSDLLEFTRSYFSEHGFAEALTPILASSYLGGKSRPFATWAAASDATQFMRVTTEIAHLELIMSGWTRCYEIGPSYRNEGLHGQRNKEFLMLEAYAADLSCDALVAIIERYVQQALYDERQLRHVSFDAAFREVTGFDCNDETEVYNLAARHLPGIVERRQNHEDYLLALWETRLHRELSGFIAVTNIPGTTSPFVAGEGIQASRMWVYIDGIEIAEISLNERNMDELRRKLIHQFEADEYPVGRDYREVVNMLAHGLPPCVGVGMGFSRLAELRRERFSVPPSDGKDDYSRAAS